jgi:hypothetical protein
MSTATANRLAAFSYAPEQFPKTCSMCGQRYVSSVEWERLEKRGTVDYDGERLEHRQCACHNTLVVVLCDIHEGTTP